MPARFYKMIVLFFVLTFVYSFSAHAQDKITPFIVMTDIHFDPFIACYKINTKLCPLIQQLRIAPANKWSAILAQYDMTPSSYREDTNYPLLTSALSAGNEIAKKTHARFVLLTGDFLSHESRRYYKKYSGDKSFVGYQAFVKKTLEFLTIKLEQAFPNIDVYAAIGNNDAYQGDYFSDPQGEFYHDTSLLWSQLIKDKTNKQEMQRLFKFAGYYAVDLQPDLRLIMLNSVLFSNKVKGRNAAKAANDEFNWLHQELQRAKENNQKVFIAMHIPVGIDVYATLRLRLFTLVETWQAKYSQRFQAELQQFYPQIAAIFAGHLHSDWFQILTFPQGEIPVSGTPSISPIFGNNPGFKTFAYSNNKKQLENYTTYSYSLNNQQGWNLEYDFGRIYQINCNHCSIIYGMSLLKNTGNLADYYKRYYAVNTNSQPITTKWDPYYWCAVREINAKQYQKCIGASSKDLHSK